MMRQIALGIVDPPVAPPAHNDGSRYYQRDAAEAVRERLARERATLVVLPTGCGKTRTAAMVVRDWRGPVLWGCHVRELLHQARGSLERVCGEPVGLEQAENYAGDHRITCFSVQTLARNERRVRSFEPSLIVLDEAHHSTSKSYTDILKFFPRAKVLGLTATPDRFDGVALGQVFQSVAYKMDIETAIEDGWLVPVEAHVLGDIKVDLTKVRKTAGDFNAADLEAALQSFTSQYAAALADKCGDRKTIAFAPRVERAHEIANALNDLYGTAVAMVVDGKTDDERRNALIREFREGRQWQYLVNVGIATEGFDAPDVQCIGMGRPTLSHGLFVQMAGRGLRPLPGIVDKCATATGRKMAIAASSKPACHLYSMRYIEGKHTLAGVTDMLGGKKSPEAKKRANELIDAGETDPAAALERAEKEAQEAAERIERQRVFREMELAQHRSAYTLTWSRFDPFAAYSIKDPELSEDALGYATEPVSAKLRMNLEISLRQKLPPNCTQRQAVALKRAMEARRAAGLPITDTSQPSARWTNLAKFLSRDPDAPTTWGIAGFGLQEGQSVQITNSKGKTARVRLGRAVGETRWGEGLFEVQR